MFCTPRKLESKMLVLFSFQGPLLVDKIVWIPNKSRVIDYNGGADIVCIVQSKVPADWSVWVKSDQSGRVQDSSIKQHTVIAKSTGVFSELVLRIKNAAEEDSGTYTCRAMFGGDIKEQSVQLTVKGISNGRKYKRNSTHRIKPLSCENRLARRRVHQLVEIQLSKGHFLVALNLIRKANIRA